MIKVIGVRFRTAGKIYFFDPLDFQVERGGHVIVETARGIEFGTVVSAPREVEDDKVIQPLKPVLRIATEKDIEQEAENKLKEKEAFKICLEKIRKHELEMKLIDAEYTFDNNKVLFYFTADGRIDFRELVKDLAGVFKTRIELRQIGVRDETKIVGGIGICGRPLCCHTHLSEFIPVSIKMAKEQNLSLNPTKISGVCGRLMCCLKHEEETYEELNRNLPNVGDTVTTEDGLQGEVQSVNVLRQLVKVIVDVNDEKEIHEYKAEDLRFKHRHSKKERVELSAEELKELEKLEAEEQLDGVEDKPATRDDWKNHRDNNRQERGGHRDKPFRQDKNHRQDKDFAQDNRQERDFVQDNRQNKEVVQETREGVIAEERAESTEGQKQHYDNRRNNRYNRNRRDNRQNDRQHRHTQPEQNIQHEGQPPPSGTAAEGAQHIIHQAEDRSQQQTRQKDLPLGRHIHMHGQRSRRARNPPCVPRLSS